MQSLLWGFCAFTTWHCLWRHYVFRMSVHLFICPDRSYRYLMNRLSKLDENYREYLLVPTDFLVRFWGSQVKVSASRWGGKASTSTLERWSLSSSYIEDAIFYLLYVNNVSWFEFFCGCWNTISLIDHNLLCDLSYHNMTMLWHTNLLFTLCMISVYWHVF